MSAAAPLARRLVAVFDPYAPDAAVLDMALRLGAPSRVTLHALFVEETEAMTLGSLPWAREVTLATGEARPLRATAVERELQRSAASARALFEAVAPGLAGARFELVRGRLAAELARVAADASAVLLGWPPAPRRSRAWARTVTTALVALRVPIVGLVASRTDPSGLLVLEAGTRPGPGRALARRLSPGQPRRIALQHGPFSARSLLERARRESLGTLLIEREALEAADELICELALRWSGSILVVD